MLSAEFSDFYRSWNRKAEEYGTQELRQCFDKFFTLFVIYNRLYAEATFLLTRRGIIILGRRSSSGRSVLPGRRNTFPDSLAAKNYVRQYLGSENLMSQLESDTQSNEAINTIIYLIETEQFYIKLDMVSGSRQRQEDLRLLDSLRSTDKAVKVRAILDFIYSIRCNMFHGHKGFNEIQVEILRPAIIILQKIVRLLYEKLSYDDD